MCNQVPFIEAIPEITHILCADCGKEIEVTWDENIDSICDECYEKAIRNDHISWQPKAKE
jgi:NMD protein affecting ribosome stability and mRNA decay